MLNLRYHRFWVQQYVYAIISTTSQAHLLHPLVSLPVQQRLTFGEGDACFRVHDKHPTHHVSDQSAQQQPNEGTLESHHMLSRAYVHLLVMDWLWSALRIRLCMSWIGGFCIKSLESNTFLEADTAVQSRFWIMPGKNTSSSE